MMSVRNEPGLSNVRSAAPVVFVVDDDISVREALQALIGTAGWRCETFPTAAAFLARGPESMPRCVVLDVSLPDLNGLDLQSRLADDESDMPIIFITGHGDIPMSVRAMKAGAIEFLTKPIQDSALMDAISQAIERSAAALVNQAELGELLSRYDSLTPRERQVMHLVVAGLLNKQVAFELGISEITVKAHRGRVMEKMRARSFADLVRTAQRVGPEPNERQHG
jgi:FixJ family two-component response regulator